MDHLQQRTAWRATIVVATALTLLLAYGLTAGDAHDLTGTDGPNGYGARVLAPHASFPDDVAATFRIKAEHDRTIVAKLHDASSVLVAEVTWEPGGSSGWHTHPGPVVVNVVEGSVELVNARDCVVHTYSAGEAFIDPGLGNVHIATNPNPTVARAYATFLGVTPGMAATEWVPPADC
jgi:quercetin dioxygenase-like cupin family protein